MSAVADDFAAIAKRLKEIEAEVAAENAAAQARREFKSDRPCRSHDVHEDTEACA
jgi:hypothetical protein